MVTPAYLGAQCPKFIDGNLYRGSDGPKVYVCQAGLLHWIPDGATLTALGLAGQPVTDVPGVCVYAQGVGADIPSVQGGAGLAPAVAAIQGWQPAPPTTSYTTPSPSAVGLTLPVPGRGMADTAEGPIGQVEAFGAAHKTALLVGGGAFLLWRSGILGALLGGRRRRY